MTFNIENFKKLINVECIDIEFEYFEEIGSTNDYTKTTAIKPNGKTHVVIASSQTKGRGRLGRKFISEKDKGIYFSVVRYGLKPEQIKLLTVTAAVCVLDALESECNMHFSIKWVNDILCNGKKICGILAENVVDTNTGVIEKSIVGIGINLYGKIDESLSGVASTVEAETGVNVSCEKLVFDIVYRLDNWFETDSFDTFLEKYRTRCSTVGKKITVNDFSEKYEALALDIDGEGRLIIEKNNKITALSSGEVSVSPIDH